MPWRKEQEGGVVDTCTRGGSIVVSPHGANITKFFIMIICEFGTICKFHYNAYVSAIMHL